MLVKNVINIIIIKKKTYAIGRLRAHLFPDSSPWAVILSPKSFIHSGSFETIENVLLNSATSELGNNNSETKRYIMTPYIQNILIQYS